MITKSTIKKKNISPPMCEADGGVNQALLIATLTATLICAILLAILLGLYFQQKHRDKVIGRMTYADAY